MPIPQWIRRRLEPATLGERGEQQAARYLKRHGHKILLTRHRHHFGEIDIIAVEGQELVFVEVKTRRSVRHGQPAEAVDARRQQRLTRAALAFLKSHGLLEYASRFDIIEVLWPQEKKRPRIRHLRNAFPAVGRGQMYS